MPLSPNKGASLFLHQQRPEEEPLFGEIAHMVGQLQSGSLLIERLARTIKSPEGVKQETVGVCSGTSYGPYWINNGSIAPRRRISHASSTMEAKAKCQQ